MLCVLSKILDIFTTWHVSMSTMKNEKLPLKLLDKMAIKRRLPPPKERRRIRLGAGLSTLDIADYLETTRTTVANWETGYCNPRGGMMARYVILLEQLERLSREAPRRNGRNTARNLGKAQKDLPRSGDIA
jgi:DNA-binding transcriptional regulator YiaG